MNSVLLIGRLTKDPDVKWYGDDEQKAVARFSLAIDRPGKDKGTDYPNIVCFGKTAELVEKYVGKGRLVGIQGRLQTGSYEKDGRKVYTTDVLADRVEFLDHAPEADGDENHQNRARGSASDNPVPEGFSKVDDDDIPF